jgi:26S proteasome regulatory subunit T4
VNKGGDIDYEAIVKVRCGLVSTASFTYMGGQLSDGFNGADLWNVITESGMFAIWDDRWVNSPDAEGWTAYYSHREYIKQEDLTKTVRKVGEGKKHESLWLPR